MRRSSWRPVRAALALVVGLSAPVCDAATIVRSADLGELVAEAGSAILADVVAVRYGRDERGLHGTWVTVRVADPIFGDGLPAAGGEYTFKSYGAPVTMPDGSRVYIDGSPSYRPGDSLLLLLLPRSRWGFSGTAGLSQGVFRVRVDARGERTAVGMAGNAGVFGERGLAGWLDPAARSGVPAAPDAPVPYAALRRAIADLARTAGKVAR
ncbi:MAG TPA: hypothetical protein VD788_06400 [Candidatus Polarisedimenticolaceae bacterium]|nr:hypothetical protein [Candidatus Polarisedimenticolaceae bacterium]